MTDNGPAFINGGILSQAFSGTKPFRGRAFSGTDGAFSGTEPFRGRAFSGTDGNYPNANAIFQLFYSADQLRAAQLPSDIRRDLNSILGPLIAFPPVSSHAVMLKSNLLHSIAPSQPMA